MSLRGRERATPALCGHLRNPAPIARDCVLAETAPAGSGPTSWAGSRNSKVEHSARRAGTIRQKPICWRPRSVRSFSVARPLKSTSKSIAAKSGAERPARKASFWRGQVGAVLGAVRRRADIDDAGEFLAVMLVADRMADVGVPPDRVARLDLGDGHHAGHHLRMPFRADAERPAGRGAAEVVLRDVVLQGAEEHVGDALGDRDELQRAVLRALAGQRRPALIGAEHRAHRRRGDLLASPAGGVPSNGS